MTATDDDLSALPLLDAEQMHTDGSPEMLRMELTALINAHLAGSPRSLQRAVGPSELGTPCARQLGYRLAGTAHVTERGPGWMPGIGTAVHAMLADAVVEQNRRLGFTRYLIETRVQPGLIAGEPLRGSADLYDRVTATVIDWKCVGVTTLKKAKRHGPSTLYRSQIQLYARGFVNRGLPVKNVTIAYLPRSGELSDGYWHTEPYDEQIADNALKRADAIATALKIAGPAAVIGQLERVDDCQYCPWRLRSTTGDDPDPATSCPGFAPAKPSAAEALIA